MIDIPVVHAATVNKEFAVHITWVEKGDPDTYVYAYDASGKQVSLPKKDGSASDSVYYGNKDSKGITLDKDDTVGANSIYENETSAASSKGGEWVSLDFATLEANGIAKVKVTVKVRINGGADITATVVDKKSQEIVTKSNKTYAESSDIAEIGFLVRSGSSWDFIDADGNEFSGSEAPAECKLTVPQNIPNDAKLNLKATYTTGFVDNRSWTKSDLDKFGSTLIYKVIQSADSNLEASWVWDGNELLAGQASIINKANTTMVIKSPPAICTLKGKEVTPQDNIGLKLLAKYENGLVETKTWTKELIPSSDFVFIPKNYDKVDLELYWVTDSGDILIEKKSIPNNSKYNVNNIELEISELPTCSCILTLPQITNITKDIGTSTGVEIDLAELNIQAEYKTNGCFKHSASDSADIPVKMGIKTQSGGNATLTDKKLKITNVGSIFNAVITATAELNGIAAEKEFNVNITRRLKAPQIISSSYNSETSKLKITITPNGHSKAEIYIKGVGTDTDIKLGDIEFQKVLWFYTDKTIEFTVRDTVAPNEVKDISAKRTEDNKNVIVSWEDGLDKDNFKDVYVTNEGQTSATTQVNIKSEATTKTVKLDYTGNTNPILPLTDKQTENSISIVIDKLHWDSKIEVVSYDKALNTSSTKLLVIPNNLIYNPTIVNDDKMSVNEGQSVVILAKENDIHDPAQRTPELKSVKVISGKGTASLIDAKQLTDKVEGVEGLVVTFLSEDGFTGNIRLEYTYTAVREDIPEAVGYIDLKTIPRNQEPTAVDDGTSVTDILAAQGGTVINIDSSLLLKNDLDRESQAKLVISAVRNVNSGTVELVNGGKTVRVTAAKVFYGLLSFEYRVSDGELVSNNWATVKINIKKVPNPPKAMAVKTSMSLDETNKAITLKVDNTGGEPYQLQNSFTAYVNGRVATAQHGITLTAATIEDENGLMPYVKLNLKKSSSVKDKDVITFNYTVFNAYGSNTSTVTIDVTSGDDPLDMEGYLYVHRKPIASFAPKIHMNPSKTFVDSVEINNSVEFSYDLDHQSSHNPSNPLKSSVPSGYEGAVRPDYSYSGLRSWEWGIKTISGNWKTKVFDAEGINAADIAALTNYGTSDAARNAGLSWIQSEATRLIDSLKASGNYESIIISLRVRDIDGEKNLGVWSDQRTVLLTSLALPPVALFQLNKSTYAVPTNSQLDLTVTDMSYDPNGDDIKSWDWELTDSKGSKLWGASYTGTQAGVNDYVTSNVKDTVVKTVNNPSWNPDVPQFKLSLVVTEQTAAELKSDKYSVTFTVYKENKAPVIDDSGTNLTLEGSTLYEEDNGADGVKGDNWGTAGNTSKPGKIDFSRLFTISDDQPTNLLRLSWLFEGENVQRRKDWSEDRRVTTQFAKSNLTYNPFEQPFTGTVTAQGFKPGAYKISVSVKDNPSGKVYPDNAAQTSYWSTNGEKKPYHLYVIPKLDLFTQVEFNGWIISGKKDGSGNWIDTSIRIEDGATLAEAGLTFEDIAPTIGDTLLVRVTTNQYVTTLWGYEDKNGNGKYTTGELKFEFERIAVNLDGTKEYIGEYTINDIADAPPGKEFTTLQLRIYGNTIWGSEVDKVTREKEIPLPVQVLPVKLYDFRVTSVTDPKLSDIFDRYIGELASTDKLGNGAQTDGALVGRLAVDRNSKPNSRSEEIDPIKKGYSFYFSVSSKGLTKDSDEVRIFPRIFAVENGVIKEELIGCVPNNLGKYKEYTKGTEAEINNTYSLFYEGSQKHDLNTHSEIRIPISLRDVDGSAQTWHGRYGIPGDAKFFYAKDFEAMGPTSDIEWKGDVIVTFDTRAYKDGRSRYNYVERGQWAKEREYIKDPLKTFYATQESTWKTNREWIGAVVLFDVTKSIRDDYTSNPVWSE